MTRTKKIFFEGEKVAVYPFKEDREKKDCFVEPITNGTISRVTVYRRTIDIKRSCISAYGYTVHGDDENRYKVVYDINGTPHRHINSSQILILERINTEELNGNFEQAIEKEIERLKNGLPRSEVRRAAVLSTLRNLNNYLVHRKSE